MMIRKVSGSETVEKRMVKRGLHKSSIYFLQVFRTAFLSSLSPPLLLYSFRKIYYFPLRSWRALCASPTLSFKRSSQSVYDLGGSQRIFSSTIFFCSRSQFLRPRLRNWAYLPYQSLTWTTFLTFYFHIKLNLCTWFFVFVYSYKTFH